jgi:hypothetical protein
MAEDAERKQQERLWDAALEKMGRDAVMAQLNNMRADRSTAFKLAGQLSCKRGYVDEWLGRGEAVGKAKDAEAKATETRRYRYNLALGVLAIVVAIAIAWWFNK